MGFNLESKGQLLDILNVGNPAEAAAILPQVKAQFTERVKNSLKAEAEAERLRAVCDENDKVLRFLAGKQQEAAAKLVALKGEVRPELYALQGEFDIEGHTARIRKLADVKTYLDDEYDFMLSVKRGADNVFFMDALEAFAKARAVEADSAALVSHVNTVASLGPAFEAEGAVGIIGVNTERLRTAAQLADKAHERARDAARDARIAYERSQVARVSKGFITSATVAQAIGR